MCDRSQNHCVRIYDLTFLLLVSKKDSPSEPAPGSSLVAQDASNKLTGAGVGGERGN